jgi:hypothetical protein
VNNTFLLALLENVEMLIALSALSQVITLLDRQRPWWEAVVRGVVFGLVGVLLMMFPYTLEAGITFDSRSVLLSLTGLFYGPDHHRNSHIHGFGGSIMAWGCRGLDGCFGYSIICPDWLSVA